MARPAKPANVIKIEGKSHRTKKELRAREQAEKSAEDMRIAENSARKVNYNEE